jgi:hypothetical protein
MNPWTIAAFNPYPEFSLITSRPSKMVEVHIRWKSRTSVGARDL